MEEFSKSELLHIRSALTAYHLKIRTADRSQCEDNNQEELHHEVWDLRRKVVKLYEDAKDK